MSDELDALSYASPATVRIVERLLYRTELNIHLVLAFGRILDALLIAQRGAGMTEAESRLASEAVAEAHELLFPRRPTE